MTTILYLLLQVDQNRVDKAVESGAKYLLGRIEKGLPVTTHFNHKDLKKREIALYALVYAGVNESDPNFKKALDEMLADRITSTYNASLQALVLEALDATKYQGRIVQCAQFLVDNQCENGQWFYGKEVDLGTWTPGASDKAKTTKTRPKIPVKVRKGVGGARGDNSNTQYAALGLRACISADVGIPRETLALAEKWWVEAQNQDGGWDYDCYETRAEHSYGGMTAGAVASLCILKYLQGKGYKQDPSIQRGLKWLSANFTVTEHAKFDWAEPASKWFYYWLYALERVGMLYDSEKIGAHDWYPEGAKYLLENQKDNGSWSEKDGDPTSATAFAILFLKRATKGLRPVATEEKKKK